MVASVDVALVHSQVLPSVAPVCSLEGELGEVDLVKEQDLAALLPRLVQLSRLLLFLSLKCRHHMSWLDLRLADLLSLYPVLQVQTPQRCDGDALVRVGPVEELGALLERPSRPARERVLAGQEVNVLLVQLADLPACLPFRFPLAGHLAQVLGSVVGYA